MTPVRRLATAFWLALALLFAQHAAAVHALAHAVDSVAQQKQLPPSHQCDECTSTANLSGALAPSLPVVAVLLPDAVTAALCSRAADVELQLAFHSRGPPPLS